MLMVNDLTEKKKKKKHLFVFFVSNSRTVRRRVPLNKVVLNVRSTTSATLNLCVKCNDV